MKKVNKDISEKEFSKSETAGKIIRESVKEIIPNKNNWFAFLISLFIAIICSFKLVLSTNTVGGFQAIVNKFLDIELTVLGYLLAVYSILLAFLNEEFMGCLVKRKDDKPSPLKKYTRYYESALFLYFIGICITGVVILVLWMLSPEFNITKNTSLNNILASILIFLYMFYSIRIFYELKSIIYNTVMLFRASIAEKFEH